MDEGLIRLWSRAERILDASIDLPEPARTAAAVAACEGDAGLEDAVRRLLRADSTADDFLATLPEGLFGAATAPLEAPAPERVGPFRIVREIGSGGMGSVWLGERDDGAFEQRVAIKLLHRELGGPDARETLVRERRILARLEHPDIARMYDGGVTAAGEPYFVMEYVDGIPIDAYAERRGLRTRERVRLLRDVCRAVEYAHGRFVVHCDLKPNNILVTPEGRVKLVDFGIARRVGDERRADPDSAGAGDRPRGGVALTPAFAAPEQLRGEEATAATDVFQLGRVLQAVLRAGAPARADADRDAGRDADLDAILARALQDSPSERYPTVEALRRDLDARLEGFPVSARRATPFYLATRYAARHRWGLAAVSAVALSLVAGLIAFAAQSRVAAAERDRARTAEGRVSAVHEFVVEELLRAPTPEASLGGDLTVAEVLRNAARSVEHAFGDDPLVEAEVRLVLARSYAALGRPEEAEPHARAADELLRATPGAPAEARHAAERARAEIDLDRGRRAEALAALEALALSPEASASAEESLRTSVALGRALTANGRLERAESVLREAVERVAAERPDDDRLRIELERGLARALALRGSAVEAEALLRAALARVDRGLGPDHPERIATETQLANALVAQLRYVEAVDLLDGAVERSRRVYGVDHPATAETLYALALAADRLGRYDVAQASLDEALEISRRALGPEHPKTVFLLYSSGVLRGKLGDPAGAEPTIREAAELRARILGPADPETIRALRSLLGIQLRLGRDAAARATALAIRDAWETVVDAPGADPDPGDLDAFAEFLLGAQPADLQDPERALRLSERAIAATGRRDYTPLSRSGIALERLGRNAEALAAYREALELPDGMRSWSTEESVVRLLGRNAGPAEVERFLAERIAHQRATPGADERILAKSLRLLALHLQETGRGVEADAAFGEAQRTLDRVVPADNWERGRLLSEHGALLAALGDRARAEPLLLEGHRILAADVQAGGATRAAAERLAALYEAWERPDEAARWRERAGGS